ncbi:MAG: SWIB/MDM2 domain-containing protein, partial [Erythrobacter sp.]|nr:SWIB/MDM2 domain-containing protein [Erythrobacter sp.]
ALQKPVQLSPELEAVVGKGPMPRTEVTSKVWAYIKANDLQKATDKRTIVPDAKLGAVIGNEEINMMKMTGKISKHLS